MLLHEFIAANRDAIIALTTDRYRGRPWPSSMAPELREGVPLFLTQLSETLRLEKTAAPFGSDAIGTTAAMHGADLFAMGFNVNQVVHVYGDVCQAITQLALDQNAPISVAEFKTLNGCLDTAIAEAVTEHARITAESRLRDRALDPVRM